MRQPHSFIKLPLNVSVSAKDIQLGTPTSPKKCPVASAIARKTGLQISVGVFSFSVLSEDLTKTVVSYSLPKAASQFISAFDCGGSSAVKPFRFRISKQIHPTPVVSL